MSVKNNLVSLTLLIFGWMGAGVAIAGVEIPAGNHVGRMKVKVTNCTEGGNTSFAGRGNVTVQPQTGMSFDASSSFTVNKFGLTCILTITFSGTVDDDGNLTGSFTHSFSCDNGFSSGGGGAFSGAYQPGSLELVIVGTDDDGNETCDFVGGFKGSGSPGPFACDAARVKLVGKLCGGLLSCHAKEIKKPGSYLLCSAKPIAKFVIGYDKATAKIMAKGGTCTYQGVAPVLAGTVETCVDNVAAGINNNGAADNAKLRGVLIKLAAKMCSSILGAETKNITRFDSAGRDATRVKARTGFLDKANGAIMKAAAKGVTYAGSTATEIADAVDACADTLLGMLH